MENEICIYTHPHNLNISLCWNTKLNTSTILAPPHAHYHSLVFCPVHFLLLCASCCQSTGEHCTSWQSLDTRDCSATNSTVDQCKHGSTSIIAIANIDQQTAHNEHAMVHRWHVLMYIYMYTTVLANSSIVQQHKYRNNIYVYMYVHCIVTPTYPSRWTNRHTSRVQEQVLRGTQLHKLTFTIYMAIWSQRIAATLVACVAETPR